VKGVRYIYTCHRSLCFASRKSMNMQRFMSGARSRIECGCQVSLQCISVLEGIGWAVGSTPRKIGRGIQGATSNLYANASTNTNDRLTVLIPLHCKQGRVSYTLGKILAQKGY